MILLIVITEANERTSQPEQIVSHGIDLETGQTITLPAEHPTRLGGVLDPELGEYVIPTRPTPDSNDRNRNNPNSTPGKSHCGIKAGAGSSIIHAVHVGDTLSS
jgi:hypothetical protein